jgi:hypothetical protein
MQKNSRLVIGVGILVYPEQSAYERNIRKSYAKCAVEQLQAEQFVRSAIYYYDHVRVRFKTGLTEKWYFHNGKLILPINPFDGPSLTVINEFPNEIEFNHLFKISYRQWRDANFYDKRTIIHKLAWYILNTKWNQPHYPHKTLVKDLERLHRLDPLKSYIVNGQLNTRRKHMAGQYLVACLTNWTESLTEYTGVGLTRAIKRLLKKHRDVTMANLVIELNRIASLDSSINRFIAPNFYRAILRRFKLSGMVIADPYPGYGCKLIASVLEGCSYHSPTTRLDKLFSFLGTKPGYMDQPHYDLVWLDYGLLQSESLDDDLTKWRSMADYLIVFVPSQLVGQFPKPDRYVKVVHHGQKIDYLYCYS